MAFPVLLIGVVVVGALVVGIVTLATVLLARGGKTQSTTQPGVASTAASVSPEDRQLILKRLADGELTKEQAEEQLGCLGSPLPEGMPTAPQSGTGISKGCLIAIIVAGLLVPLALLTLGALLFFGCAPRVVEHHTAIGIERPVTVQPEIKP